MSQQCKLYYIVPLCIELSIKSVLLAFFAAFLPVNLVQAQTIAINEVMSSNGQTIADEDGDYEDWIELYNYGTASVHLSGFGLSDDYDYPYRWVFPDTTIDPGHFLMIWASNKNRRIPGSALHVNFAIASTGEEVILTNPDGERVDKLPPVSIPRDVSAGRYPDGTGPWHLFDEPTPGASNVTDPERLFVAPPVFSHPSGFYPLSFHLELTHPDPDAVIHYTLDGSKPDSTSPVYTAPIRIFDRNRAENHFANIPTNFLDGARGWREPPLVRKATPVRAVAFGFGALSNVVVTNTYMVETGTELPYSLPVAFLSTDENNLFDFEKGIYVAGKYAEETDGQLGNYDLRGDEWEREASFELFDEAGRLVLNQDIGIRIHGGFSRRFPQKSLRLYARGDYGQTRFNAKIFPDLPYDQYNRLILRNSGNDWGNSLFRDAAAQSLVRHLDLDTQAYRPVILFINGEYWGIHNIRERYDQHYLERVYGVDPDNVDILSGVDEVEKGDDAHYRELLDLLSGMDAGKESETDHIYEQIATMMDINNFLDYYAAQIYYANDDWPNNNIDYWRLRVPYNPFAKTGHDGRWRWLLYDVDRSLDFQSGVDFNMMDHITDGGPETLLIDRLLRIEKFRHEFINRNADLLNSAFMPERVRNVIDSLKAPLEPEIEEHIRRWWWPTSFSRWNVQVERMRNSADVRPGYVRQHIRDHFGLGDDRTITVDIYQSGHGKIRVNSIKISPETPGISDNPYPWSGTYFDGVPVILKAEAKPGYRFANWEIDGDPMLDNPIVLPANGDYHAVAYFIANKQDSVFPKPAILAKEDYHFTQWSPVARTGEYPSHMAFVYMDEDDPGLNASIDGFTSGAYNLESRTRIVGLNEQGFAFINTSNPEGNPGYPGTRLGGALLALDTRNIDQAAVTFSAGTVLPNSRIYHIRLQYRVGDEGAFTDFPDQYGNPVEYQWKNEAGHSETVTQLLLPEDVYGQEYIQLFWRYYFTGNRIDENSGQRAKLNISEIHVYQLKESDSEAPDQKPGEISLYQNFPNPFGSPTTFHYDLDRDSHIRLEIYSIDGRKVATMVNERQSAGTHQVVFDGSGLAAGLYIYRLRTDAGSISRKMIRL